MFKGVYTALITPFKDGKVDYDALEKIIEHQIAGGVTGLLPMGTTGESPTVSHEEHIDIIKKTVEIANKRVNVIAGSGSNSTSEAVCLTESAAKAGVDGVLLVNPYYNKPPQNALVDHFYTISQSVDIPIMLYNIPSRTGINFEPESIAELAAKADNVKAVKAASGDIPQIMRLYELCRDRLDIMSGDDNLLLPIMGIGGKGIVSVVSNIVPGEVVKVVNLYQQGNISEARDAFYKLLPLCRMMFLETNPIPIKAVMAKAGFCTGDIRKPLLPLSEEKLNTVVDAFRNYGVSI